jgi:hypothetical protein
MAAAAMRNVFMVFTPRGVPVPDDPGERDLLRLKMTGRT